MFVIVGFINNVVSILSSMLSFSVEKNTALDNDDQIYEKIGLSRSWGTSLSEMSLRNVIEESVLPTGNANT